MYAKILILVIISIESRIINLIVIIKEIVDNEKIETALA